MIPNIRLLIATLAGIAEFNGSREGEIDFELGLGAVCLKLLTRLETRSLRSAGFPILNCLTRSGGISHCTVT